MEWGGGTLPRARKPIKVTPGHDCDVGDEGEESF